MHLKMALDCWVWVWRLNHPIRKTSQVPHISYPCWPFGDCWLWLHMLNRMSIRKNHLKTNTSLMTSLNVAEEELILKQENLQICKYVANQGNEKAATITYSLPNYQDSNNILNIILLSRIWHPQDTKEYYSVSCINSSSSASSSIASWNSMCKRYSAGWMNGPTISQESSWQIWWPVHFTRQVSRRSRLALQLAPTTNLQVLFKIWCIWMPIGSQ